MASRVDKAVLMLKNIYKRNPNKKFTQIELFEMNDVSEKSRNYQYFMNFKYEINKQLKLEGLKFDRDLTEENSKLYMIYPFTESSSESVDLSVAEEMFESDVTPKDVEVVIKTNKETATFNDPITGEEKTVPLKKKDEREEFVEDLRVQHSNFMAESSKPKSNIGLDSILHSLETMVGSMDEVECLSKLVNPLGHKVAISIEIVKQ